MSTMEQAAEQIKGLLQETSPEVTQEAQESTEPTEAVETEVQASEEPQEVSQEPVEATDEQPSEVEGADAGAETLELGAEELAGLIGVNTDQLNITDDGQIRFRAKEGEEISDVTLDQLINAYQGNANLTNRSKQIAELEKRHEQELAALVNQSQQWNQQQQALLETLQQEFLAPYENINWQELREDDPSEYAARRQELADRKQRFSELQSAAQQSLAEANQHISAEMHQQQQAYLMAQRDRLMENIPNWNENIAQDVTSYLKSQGLSDEVISSTNDATAITLAYKAMLFDQGKANAEKKLQKPMPKVLKVGKRPSKAEVNGVQESKLKQAHKKSGSIESAAQIFRQRFKQ